MNRIEEGMEDLGKGELVMMVEEEEGENEGEVVVGGEVIRGEKVNLMVKDGRGVVWGGMRI